MSLQRAHLLLESRQYELAEVACRAHLLAMPDVGYGHALLALCLSLQHKTEAALDEASAALRLAPSLAYAHFALARMTFDEIRYLDIPFVGRSFQDKNVLTRIRTAINEAIRLDPSADEFHACKAELEWVLERWQPCLAAAEAGLALNPRHVACANFRALALLHLGRQEDAFNTISQALAVNPEDPFTHATKGWTALRAGEPVKAMESFREGLRLDPNATWSQLGLLEALKAQHPFCGMLLGWKLRSAIWRAHPHWKRRCTGVLVLLYALVFTVVTRILSERTGYSGVSIRATFALAICCSLIPVLGLAVWSVELTLLHWLQRQTAGRHLVTADLQRRTLMPFATVGAGLIGVFLAAVTQPELRGFCCGLIAPAGCAVALLELQPGSRRRAASWYTLALLVLCPGAGVAAMHFAQRLHWGVLAWLSVGLIVPLILLRDIDGSS